MSIKISNTIPNIYLTNPQINTIFADWYSQQFDRDNADSLLRKLNLLSLNHPTLLAALLFLNYENSDDIPKDFQKKKYL